MATRFNIFLSKKKAMKAKTISNPTDKNISCESDILKI